MLRKILMIICVIICLIFISKIIIDVVDEKEGTSFYNSTLPSHNKIDVKNLTKEYPNVKAYIKIDGTNIDYPVVQGEDNEYYLSHLPNDKKNQMGSIYLDYRNKNFSDDNTIIYGHNMNDGTMFSELENYKKSNYYENHKYYILYTEEGELQVEIVAGYIADAAKESLPVNFDSTEDRKEYIDKVTKNNILNSDVNIQDDDKIISLCTCADIYDTSRLVLIGKVINN